MTTTLFLVVGFDSKEGRGSLQKEENINIVFNHLQAMTTLFLVVGFDTKKEEKHTEKRKYRIQPALK